MKRFFTDMMGRERGRVCAALFTTGSAFDYMDFHFDYILHAHLPLVLQQPSQATLDAYPVPTRLMLSIS